MKTVHMGASASVVVLAAALAACGPSGGAGPGAASDRAGGVTAQAAADGAILYDANCAGCHGPLATSGVAGASAGAITTAIANDVGGMGSISLTSAEIADIVLALAGTGGGGGGSDGAALYAANCAGCHGALAQSQVRGESAGDIREAIQENEGGMGALASLTDAELQAIASALGGGGGGGGGGGDDDGDDDGDHHGGDDDGDGGGGGGGGGSGDGAALYTANCAGCHGALAGSDVRGESAGDIREAIQENKGGMGSLASLTDAQLQAIASALGGGGGGGGGGGSGDGAALYTANCAGCHGALAQSQVRGESAGDIREAIQENEGGMGVLASLTDAQLQAIASALGGGSGGSGGGGGGGDGGGDDGDGGGGGGGHHHDDRLMTLRASHVIGAGQASL